MRLARCDVSPTDSPSVDRAFSTACNPESNRVLRALRPQDRSRVFPNLKVVDLRKNEMLFENGPESHFMYFPIDAVLSLRHILLDGHGCDLARVGREGMIGLVLSRGTVSTTYCTQVQTSGQAFRLNSTIILSAAESSVSLRSLLLCCFNGVLMQIAQSVACNRHHTIQQQLCRYLLDSLDHGSGNGVACTHEQIAGSLGVRREGVTEAAIKLQKEGVIQYRRGHIEVVNRGGVEARSCECYEVVKRQIQGLLPG